MSSRRHTITVTIVAIITAVIVAITVVITATAIFTAVAGGIMAIATAVGGTKTSTLDNKSEASGVNSTLFGWLPPTAITSLVSSVIRFRLH